MMTMTDLRLMSVAADVRVQTGDALHGHQITAELEVGGLQAFARHYHG